VFDGVMCVPCLWVLFYCVSSIASSWFSSLRLYYDARTNVYQSALVRYWDLHGLNKVLLLKSNMF